MLENTCRAQPRWCVNVVWCHLRWADAAAVLLCIDQTAEVSRLLQVWVWVTKLMHSVSKEFGDGLLCLTVLVHFGWKTLSFLPLLPVYTVLRAFSNSCHFSCWGHSIFLLTLYSYSQYLSFLLNNMSTDCSGFVSPAVQQNQGFSPLAYRVRYFCFYSSVESNWCFMYPSYMKLALYMKLLVVKV